ncbi:hypothetical protein [Rufibacter ruber]|uniref:hypothetical protein n=1 Tax=Rufibacter ruber TaxID=1783499 RepID=UPI00083692AD|nr:hypothetical protein [Rufibacter ruber]
MKKTLFTLALAAGMMTFNACGNSQEERTEDNMEEVEDAAEEAGDEVEDGAEEVKDEVDDNDA